MKSYNFDQLFILDLANNHQGDLEHGLHIIREVGKAVAEFGIRAALKLQFRDLDTFIHPSHRKESDNKHVPRFLGTRLSWDEYRVLTDAVREAGMVTMATPFDEASLQKIKEMDVEIVKVASCSGADRPLLSAVAQGGKPVVVSTAGLGLEQIDYLVHLMEESLVEFALMHCVAIYPTPDEQLRLNQIDFLRERFPKIPVGFSTHENQDATWPIQVAYAKKAQLFERHVGIPTDRYQLNAYSSTPDQLRQWFAAYRQAEAACGGEMRSPAPAEERQSLQSLSRGVFAGKKLAAGEELTKENTYFAMPPEDGCLTANDWKEGLLANRDYQADEPLEKNLEGGGEDNSEVVGKILLQVKGMLSNARIPVGRDSSIEISHHYGLDRFREFGAVIIDCINRKYCKKLIVMLPRQKHPYHYHEVKEETFQLLSGDLEVELDGHRHTMKPGDTLLVDAGKWHKFHTLDGAIFEEVSTTHVNSDSFYNDEKIASLTREERKTQLPNWEAIDL